MQMWNTQFDDVIVYVKGRLILLICYFMYENCLIT